MKPRVTLTILLLVALQHRAAANPAPEPEVHDEHKEQAHAPTPPAAAPEAAAVDEETASLRRIGAAKLESGDAASALIAYRQLATRALDDRDKAEALLGLARAYRLSGDGVKAAATYEHIVKEYPEFPDLPAALLELGRTLRDIGSPKLAIARFYSVINSTLKLPGGEADHYRRIVRTAQFEIAETHLSSGNYPEAVRFFNRLDLLDLSPSDRSRARFKAAQSRIYAGDQVGAVAALSVFIAQDPDDPHSPEARFLLARLLSDLGRSDESLRVTLELLTHEHSREVTTNNWRVWQRRTGNQLANQFYEHGEFSQALLLYRALDSLDTAPNWRVPALYQMGLCQERLAQPSAAIKTYELIQKLSGSEPPQELADIARMAAWRTKQLSWTISTREQITNLRPEIPAPPSEPTS